MEEKSKFDELLIAYLAGELSVAEEALFLEWVATNGQGCGAFELIKDVEDLVSAKKAMNEVDLEQEWSRFKQTLVNQGKWTVANDAVVRKECKTEDAPRQRGTVRKLALCTAAAASVLVILWLGWGLFKQSAHPDSGLVARTDEANKRGVPFRVVHEYNHTGKAKKLILEDGSAVMLEDQSEIIYTVPFQNMRRDISLKGKALFKVAKDPEKPFTVYSGDIRTTALGTEFSVTNFESQRFVIVRLQEGKVVVQSVDSVLKQLKRAYNLQPGQELVYDRRSVTAKVRSYKTTLPKKVKESRSLDNPSLPMHTDGNWFMFNNQPLPEIFDQLESMFGVRIDYKRKEVERLYFIGKFDKNDSLEFILENISTINKLKLSRIKNGYMIKK